MALRVAAVLAAQPAAVVRGGGGRRRGRRPRFRGGSGRAAAAAPPAAPRARRRCRCGAAPAEASESEANNNSAGSHGPGGAVPRVALAAAAGTACLLAAAAAGACAGAPWAAELLSARAAVAEAFLLILVSELGDKTFFIAALLAMRRGRAAVFVGAVLALALMTLISVGIGAVFNAVPYAVANSEDITKYVASALLLWFGLRTLQDAGLFKRDEEGGEAGSELEEAEEVVAGASGSTGQCAEARSWWQVVGEAFSLTFVAEWGDRSMLATIALGAAQSPAGVAAGAIAGHAVATVVAVVGGALLSKHISERAVGITGGFLFLAFAVATAFGVY